MRVLQAKTKRPLDVLAVSAGGHVAAASSAFEATGIVDVWDVATGKVVFSTAGSQGTRQTLAFAPDGGCLFVSEEQAVAVFAVPGGKLVARQPIPTREPDLALSPDGARLLAAASNEADGDVTCFELGAKTSFRRLWSVGPDRFILYGDPAFSPDGNVVAVSMHDGFRDHVHNLVHLRAAGTGKLLRTIDFDLTGADPIKQIAFSADGAKVLVRASGRVVKVFDAATGQLAGELLHPGRPYVTGMAVHPNGEVACARNDGTVCFWNLEKRELTRRLAWNRLLSTGEPLFKRKLVSVAFAFDGSIGAAGTEDGQVVVWDVDE
jgi:WD40 repeat protein